VNTWTRGWTAASNGEGLLSAVCSLATLSFRREDVPVVRRFATAFGVRAGMGGAQLQDFVLAVSEAAACALSHGPGVARLRLWSTGARVLCEIDGAAALSVHGPGAVERGDLDLLRHWVLKQLCDHVDVEPGPCGVTVRFAMMTAA
jgi:hypothetical protein